MSDTCDIAIVGSGLAGLAAALTAARAGASVALFERASHTGGRAQTTEVSGFRMNLGPHGLFGGADRLLASFGIDLPGGSPDLGYTVRRGKVFPARVGGSPDRAGLIGPRAAREFSAFARAIATTPPAELDSVSIADLLARHVTTEGGRQYSLAVLRLLSYVDAPDLQSAGGVAFHFQQGPGVRYINGGWQTIVTALRTAAEQAGARILTSARVEAVEPTSGGALAVRLAGGASVSARAAILAVSPRDAARLAPASSQLDTWARASIPVEAACLDVSLQRLPARARRFALGVDQPLYLSTHSQWAAGLAPEGSALVSVAKYLRPGEPSDADAVLQELEAFLDLAQSGWRQLRVASRYLPSITVTNDLTSASRGGLSGRPGPGVPGTPGLFVAGDWVGARGLLAQASLESGIAAAQSAVALSPAREAALTG